MWTNVKIDGESKWGKFYYLRVNSACFLSSAECKTTFLGTKNRSRFKRKKTLSEHHSSFRLQTYRDKKMEKLLQGMTTKWRK